MPKNSKKPTRSKIVKKLDVIFSQYIRLKYSDNQGMTECFTCGKRDHWKKLQCGHFQSRKNYSTRWSEDNCRVQCVSCNMFKSGEQYTFGRNLVEYLAEKMFLESKKIVKFTTDELIDMIDLFASKVKKLMQ